MERPLTVKQEKACQAYLKFGDKSAAYREAYSCQNMKAETVNRKAFELFQNGKIAARIEVLQSELQERNKIEIDELVSSLSGMVRFDIADLYDQDGNLLSIHKMPKSARMMIQHIELDEVKFLGKKGKATTQVKKVRIIPKLDAIEKLMKHLGGYAVDNSQKKTDVIVNSVENIDKRIGQILSKAVESGDTAILDMINKALGK